ncbi:multicopper oxidase [Sphaerobolus stellatus SS14]|uniref:Multicopper oxidase n=1 Tax=Sphaerobolus stellatus (strain SS14) TaxID=990650 RepID=A0A0C9V7J6_SPHS4|nr:multicopper oxidase [Sphaerobolus stellatus SS14]
MNVFRSPFVWLASSLFILTPIAFICLFRLEFGLALLRHRQYFDDVTIPSSLPKLRPQLESAFTLEKIAGQPPQTRVYDFAVEMVKGATDGISRTMLVVNGQYPGPTIEANQHDRLVVHVKNNLPETTSIHWHGLFQNGTNFYDGTAGITECGIPPGGSLIYNFTFGAFSGTTWWHSPYSTQSTDGVSGALVVHPTLLPPLDFPTWDEDVVVQVADWYHDSSEDLLVDYFSFSGVAGVQGNEPVPDSGTINGIGQWGAPDERTSYFKLTVQRNKTYRLRIINTGSLASIRFSVDWHPLTLIEADGILLKPTLVEAVTITVAQRYSVLLHTTATSSPNGLYWMRAAVQENMFRYQQPGQNRDIRGIIQYFDASELATLPDLPDSSNPGTGAEGALDVNGRTILTPLVIEPPPESSASYYMTISFQKIFTGRVLGFMNTTSWEPLQGESTLMAVRRDPQNFAMEGASIVSEQFMVTEDTVRVIDLIVDNLDDGDHPFHIHGLRPWIVAAGPGRYIGQPLDKPNPLRRDTFLVPAYSHFVLRLVTDNPGVWAFHCHISWHAAGGLLMQINSLPSKAAQFDIPEQIISHCRTTPSTMKRRH